MNSKINSYINSYTNASPLAVFRIGFGLMMLYSILRFWNKGWIYTLYIEPKFHFKYYGFEWVRDLGDFTYILFVLCIISSIFITIGYKYRFSMILFFLSFTYIELIDKTTYLNHYYFISILSFLMIFLHCKCWFFRHMKFVHLYDSHIFVASTWTLASNQRLAGHGPESSPLWDLVWVPVLKNVQIIWKSYDTEIMWFGTFTWFPTL